MMVSKRKGFCMALREIRLEGDETLRKTCRPVTEINDRVRMLLQDLADTLNAEDNTAGLAAPQIGILRRLIVVKGPDGLIKLVNPCIVEARGEQEVEEGCLSLPGRWGKLLRPESVTVQALGENGDEVTIEARDDFAKLLCHEIDHLDGILFIDKVTEFSDDDEGFDDMDDEDWEALDVARGFDDEDWE